MKCASLSHHIINRHPEVPKLDRDEYLKRKMKSSHPMATTTIESLAMTLQTTNGYVLFEDVIRFVEALGKKIIKNKSIEDVSNLKTTTVEATISPGSKYYSCPAPPAQMQSENPTAISANTDEKAIRAEFPDNRRITTRRTKYSLKCLGLNQKFEWAQEIPNENSVNPFKRFYGYLSYMKLAGDSNEKSILRARRTHVSEAANLWLQSQRQCDSTEMNHQAFDINLVKHPEAIIACVDKLKNVCKMNVSSLKNKIQALINFINFYKGYLLNPEERDDVKLAVHMSITISKLTALRRRYCKIIKTNADRAMKRMDPTVFENYVNIYKKAVENEDSIKKAEDTLRLFERNETSVTFRKELIFLNQYLVGRYTLINGLRAGNLSSMTIDEFESRQRYVTTKGARFIIGIADHKTKGQGKALLSLSEKDERLFSTYFKCVRPLIKNSLRSKYFLLSSEGSKLSGPRLIKEYQQIYVGGNHITAGIGKFPVI